MPRQSASQILRVLRPLKWAKKEAMLDIKYIRENRKEVEEMLQKRGSKVDVAHLLEIDEQRRKLIGEVEELRRDRKEIAQAKEVEEGRELKQKLNKKGAALSAIEAELKEELLKLPNILLKSVPVGDETANKIIKKEGEPPKFDFPPKDHVDLGEALDIIDIQRAAKVAGSRFAYLKNEAVLIEFALVSHAFKILVKEGFSPIIPPELIKKEITDGLGYWQGGGNENYYLVSDFEISETKEGKPLDLYLIGTGEHALIPMHADEIFTQGVLPKRYAAFSHCFRREAGTYGKDTRGILRVHQFDKVEMVSFCKPEDDEKEREKMLSVAERLMKDLEIPYRVVELASGDLALPSAQTIDIEAWIPSQNKYRETHSISTTTDFQARRLNIKYKEGNETKLVHILNGTALAIGRTLIAILENYQQADGSVKIPQVLHEYLGKDIIQRPK